MVHKQNFPPAVVTPLDCHMGLDIARSLSKYGIKVFGVDSHSDASLPGIYSKCVNFYEAPNHKKNNGQEYIDFLIELGKSLPEKSVIYPLSDAHVLLLSKYRNELENYYQLVLPDHEILVRLASKDGLQEFANDFDIPSAKTIYINNPREIEEISSGLTFPIILKPTRSSIWQTSEMKSVLKPGITSGHAKVVLCHNPSDLILAYKNLSAIDPRLIIQEVIPGEDSRLFYFSFYLNRNSIPLGVFAGRKQRIIPVGFGSASYVHSHYDDELISIGLRLLKSAKYKGLGGIEFKKDSRDDQYKLVEFNTRFGMWDGLGEMCGVDLAYIAYLDAVGLDVDRVMSYRQGVIWVDIQRDLRSAIENYRRGNLSITDWFRSLRGEKMWAIYSREDWKPGFVFTMVLVKNLLKRIFNLNNS